MRILVTGGAGFIGSNLVNNLARIGMINLITDWFRNQNLNYGN